MTMGDSKPFKFNKVVTSLAADIDVFCSHVHLLCVPSSLVPADTFGTHIGRKKKVAKPELKHDNFMMREIIQSYDDD